jgi:hypothetical protein
MTRTERRGASSFYLEHSVRGDILRSFFGHHDDRRIQKAPSESSFVILVSSFPDRVARGPEAASAAAPRVPLKVAGAGLAASPPALRRKFPPIPPRVPAGRYETPGWTRIVRAQARKGLPLRKARLVPGEILRSWRAEKGGKLGGCVCELRICAQFGCGEYKKRRQPLPQRSPVR